jgi:hypothetical protein
MRPAAAGLRIRASLIAVAAGWIAALVATLPMQFVKIYGNAFGGLRPLLWSLAAGTWIWSVWLLAIAGGAWLFGGLPLIAMVRESWLRSHPFRAIVISALLGWSIVLVKFKVWKLLLPDEGLSVRGFCLYSLTMIALTGVATAVYCRRLARIAT